MSKEYVFEFNGTKQEFIKKLDLYPNNTSYDGNKFYYFDDYIVKIVDNTIHFGVERCGHSGGNWFVPHVTEFNDRIEFCGTVKYDGPVDDRGKMQRALDGIGYVLLFILILPIVVIISLYQVVAWVVRKLSKKEKQMPKTTEEKLFDLMINHLGCTRKENK